MDLNARLAALRHLDPEHLSDAEVRAALPPLLAFAEEAVTALLELRAEVQRLKDEIARLKGEQGKPHVPPNRPSRIIHPIAEPGGHSSEGERREREGRKPWKKRAKLARLVVDRTVSLTCDPGTLPPDARFKGYQPVVVQNLVIHTENLRFLRAKFYSPATGKTYLAPLPPGYEGGFGPGVKTLSLSLVYGCHLSHPLLYGFLTDAGLDISHGQVTRLVTEGLERFHAEEQEVLRAGLGSSPWQHLDVTPTRVDGENHACHVLGNPLFSHYHTTRRQDRAAALEVLRGGRPRCYRLDATAYAYLAEGRVAGWVVRALQRCPQEETWKEREFQHLLDRRLPLLGTEQRQHVEVAASLAAYRADPSWPVVSCLVADDAATFPGLTAELALCWVHDGRHYQKLNPQFACHRAALSQFRKRYWDYYRELLTYREAPSPEEAARLETAFDTLFATESPWRDLQTCIDRTRANKAKLLLVLKHPELPLHNNPAELAARRRVRKRDMSFGPRSEAGKQAWDTFQGLAETTRKLGVRFWSYLWDRVTAGGQVPALADLLTERARSLHLGASWAPG